MATITTSQAPTDILYPERDGKPMGETDTHRKAISDTIATITDFFRDQPDVYVAGDLLLYYEEGNPAAVVVPDVFVVQGIANHSRRTYKLWEELVAPVAVFEISSKATRLEDKGNKRVLYAALGVDEYFLFDPLAEYLKPPLQGFRLVGEEYVRLEPEADSALVSQTLGLRLRRETNRLRLIDLASDEQLLWPDETAAARRVAEQQLEIAERQLEAEVATRRLLEQRLAAIEVQVAELIRRGDSSSSS